MSWEIVIGLETHVQLATQSKIFSGASTQFGAMPNTQACAVDLALPGVLPVLNRKAVEYAIRLGLAVDAHVAERSTFERKNYFYPDLPKGYQISQNDIPVVQGGHVDIVLGDTVKRVRLVRAHLEEDAGKSLHEDFAGMTGIDLNRAGTPLLEVVTEPDMCSAEEAVAYAKALHGLVTWLGISDGNMQEGSFRCDANVSVRRTGAPLGTRCEIKNLNSFKFLQQAIVHEAQRQIELIEDGGRVVQETRLYDPDRNETRSMRSKEDAMDYRYFPDPDLPPLCIAADWIETVRQSMPELPSHKRERYQTALGLPAYDASVLTGNRALSDYFEALLNTLGDAQAKLAANWLMGEVSSQLNRDGIEWAKAPVQAPALAKLLQRILDNTLSNKLAKEVFIAMWESSAPADADDIIAARGLKQITDTGAIETMIDEVMAANPGPVAEYRSGKEKAFNSLVGMVMKQAKGKANPATVNEVLKKKLQS
jgi:aspartyl-tRNA(Asn)/glutamyl-tRNA(Gln) amidotransferase subunit B